MSSRVNKAYKTLLDPYTRAEYLLRKEGLEIGESDGVQDEELISTILELRMALEEAEDQEDVDEIRTENAGTRPDHIAMMAELTILPIRQYEDSDK